jgi:hypothetical protein
MKAATRLRREVSKPANASLSKLDLLRAEIMRTILIIALLGITLFGQASSTWKMNQGKSTHKDGKPFPRSLVIRLEPHPEGETITIWHETQDGKSQTDSFILRYDGKDHPYPREELFNSFSARKLEDGASEILYKKDGKVVEKQIRRLMADGQQIKIQCQLLSENGRWLNRVLVLEKQEE